MTENNEKYTVLKRKVSGGDLPDGQEWKMDVTADFSEVSPEDMRKLAFRSAWIAEQGHLRKKSVKELDKLVETGYEFSVSETLNRQRGGGGFSSRAVLRKLGVADDVIDIILNNPELANEELKKLAGK